MLSIGETVLLPSPLPDRVPDVIFFVPGKARPGGSKNSFRNPHTGKQVVVENSDNKMWRNRVASCCSEAYRGPPVEGPVVLAVVFVRLRPRGHYGTGRNANRLKPSAPKFPTSRPDLLKLTRLLEDALSLVMYRDDAQIVDEHLSERYGDRPGAHVSVWVLTGGRDD